MNPDVYSQVKTMPATRVGLSVDGALRRHLFNIEAPNVGERAPKSPAIGEPLATSMQEYFHYRFHLVAWGDGVAATLRRGKPEFVFVPVITDATLRVDQTSVQAVYHATLATTFFVTDATGAPIDRFEVRMETRTKVSDYVDPLPKAADYVYANLLHRWGTRLSAVLDARIEALQGWADSGGCARRHFAQRCVSNGECVGGQPPAVLGDELARRRLAETLGTLQIASECPAAQTQPETGAPPPIAYEADGLTSPLRSDVDGAPKRTRRTGSVRHNLVVAGITTLVGGWLVGWVPIPISAALCGDPEGVNFDECTETASFQSSAMAWHGLPVVGPWITVGLSDNRAEQAWSAIVGTVQLSGVVMLSILPAFRGSFRTADSGGPIDWVAPTVLSNGTDSAPGFILGGQF